MALRFDRWRYLPAGRYAVAATCRKPAVATALLMVPRTAAQFGKSAVTARLRFLLGNLLRVAAVSSNRLVVHIYRLHRLHRI